MSSVLAAAKNRPAYHPHVDVAAEPVGGLCTRQRGRDGVGRAMEPGAETGAANGEKVGATDDAASGEDAGVMSRATPSAGRTWMWMGASPGSVLVFGFQGYSTWGSCSATIGFPL